MPQPKKKAQRPQAAAPAQALRPAKRPVERPPLTGPAELRWTYNPWVDAKMRGWRRPWLALLACTVCAAIAGFSFSWPDLWPGMLPWTAMGLLILLGMCSTLFLPVSYKLDNKGVTVIFLLAPSFRPWEHYRNYYVHDTLVHLTTMPQPSPLDAFRGHPLQYGRLQGRKEEVIAFISQRIERELPREAGGAVVETQPDADSAATAQ